MYLLIILLILKFVVASKDYYFGIIHEDVFEIFVFIFVVGIGTVLLVAGASIYFIFFKAPEKHSSVYVEIESKQTKEALTDDQPNLFNRYFYMRNKYPKKDDLKGELGTNKFFLDHSGYELTKLVHIPEVNWLKNFESMKERYEKTDYSHVNFANALISIIIVVLLILLLLMSLKDNSSNFGSFGKMCGCGSCLDVCCRGNSYGYHSNVSCWYCWYCWYPTYVPVYPEITVGTAEPSYDENQIYYLNSIYDICSLQNVKDMRIESWVLDQQQKWNAAISHHPEPTDEQAKNVTPADFYDKVKNNVGAFYTCYGSSFLVFSSVLVFALIILIVFFNYYIEDLGVVIENFLNVNDTDPEERKDLIAFPYITSLLVIGGTLFFSILCTYACIYGFMRCGKGGKDPTLYTLLFGKKNKNIHEIRKLLIKTSKYSHLLIDVVPDLFENAVENDDIEMVQLLMYIGYVPRQQDLLKAIGRRNVEMIKLFIDVAKFKLYKNTVSMQSTNNNLKTQQEQEPIQTNNTQEPDPNASAPTLVYIQPDFLGKNDYQFIDPTVLHFYNECRFEDINADIVIAYADKHIAKIKSADSKKITNDISLLYFGLDGSLAQKDYISFFKHINPTLFNQEILEVKFNELDDDKDGFIRYDDMVNFGKPKKVQSTDVNLKAQEKDSLIEKI